MTFNRTTLIITTLSIMTVWLCGVSFMLSVANKPFVQSVVMLNVVMVSVIVLNVVMLNVVMASVFVLSVAAPFVSIQLSNFNF